MNHKGVCRTAPATPSLLKSRDRCDRKKRMRVKTGAIVFTVGMVVTQINVKVK